MATLPGGAVAHAAAAHLMHCSPAGVGAAYGQCVSVHGRDGGCIHPYVALTFIPLCNGGSGCLGTGQFQLGLQDEPGMLCIGKSCQTCMLPPASGRERC